MTWLKIYLPIYLLLYLLVAFVIPTYRTYKKTGINPVTFGKSENAHDYIGFVMKILIALLFFSVLIFSIFQNFYLYLCPIHFLQNSIVQLIGLVLIHFSLIWISVAQFQMSNSWRIGIDENNRTELVTTGIFSISRNPIFLGMILSVLGLFLITPNAIMFCLTFTTYIIIQIQIRLEEEFLERQHTKNYINYKQKTRRLI
ncbi:isoprenylcysteine carboxylmethyltransferase family protein [Flavobacterium filum]|uniref:methyltransferase family protein n=1 Tax=Flavobacterium filum TaxID=370974 RepID=UPI0023F39A1C|nr:isoprenylcysteine carboxylmethyltransferase family protein [Flavobacterium filum]HMZ47312.1 isoprenylcysteine carboxylmethyltransferase family protein [Chitinophagaceae bacterium]